MDRQVYYRNLKRRDTRKNNAKQVVAMVAEIRKHSPKMGGRKLYFLFKKRKSFLKNVKNRQR
ncbi:conserved hypothetical protein [Capnocytophaga canimorsus]|uniref:Uncharacterized protein n=1 Tax=Capnocytophaga canimorsus TaxID=28188 RepID=A0A0B7IKV0_9FLAO|nr:conserved hypothetical protein [Capnocytophaga canimorsus]